jgi:hypothetical protein
MQLPVWVNKKLSIGVESGTVDDIEYAKSEIRSSDINRARQPMYTACLSGDLIGGNDI